MTPTEFEKFTISELNNQFNVDGIQNFSFQHNVIKKAYDGSYQIDGEIKFTLMGVDYDTLVECKLYSNPVERKEVQVLYDKIRSTGAQKGIFVTTSSFQSGAIRYAKEHGIALISFVDGKMCYHTRSRDTTELFDSLSLMNEKPYCMALQVYRNNGIVSVYFLENSKALFEYIIK